MSQSPIAEKSIYFIELAKELRNTDTNDLLYEVKMRSAIGRLYYGVFNLLIDRFLNCGHSKLDYHLKQSLRDNSKVHYALKQCISRTNSSMKTHIDKLRDLRNFCDYDLSKNVMEKMVIEKENPLYSSEYDNIEFAYAEAMASTIVLIRTYTDHQKCYDSRGHKTKIEISAS